MDSLNKEIIFAVLAVAFGVLAICCIELFDALRYGY